jgi:hypothetical protein|tara:strand:- start:1397 stop:1594 length:198 start_codon:yes stop_codon:yes gene_type:complete
MAKAIIDNFMERIVSRKFLVWVTATVLAILGALASSDWVTISIVYVGTQGALDIARKLKKCNQAC